jgi:hypothetical protein
LFEWWIYCLYVMKLYRMSPFWTSVGRNSETAERRTAKPDNCSWTFGSASVSLGTYSYGIHQILLERLVLMTCEMWHSMRSQNLIDVTGSCYSIASPRAKILENTWTKFHIESDATPYHDAWTAPNIPFLRFTRATEAARQTVGTHQRPISADMVRHRLVTSNLRCYRPARGPVLTPRHRLVNRFRKCWRTINLFWRAVVTCGIPQRGRSFVLFVAL